MQEAALEALQVPLKHAAVTCMSWTHWSMVSRLPVWPPKTGNRPSWQTPSWNRWLQRCGPVPVEADWLTWALAAPSEMQPPQAEAEHPVQKSSAKRVSGGTVLVGVASHAQGDHSGRIPWWDQPLRLWKNAQHDVQLFLLAPNGCTGEGACQEVLTEHHLQSKTTEGFHGKYCSYLCLELGKGREENVLVVSNHLTQYAQVYITQWHMAQAVAKVLWDNFIVHYGLPEKNPFSPWEWTNNWPLQVDWYQEVQDQPIPPPDKWPVKEVQLYLNQYVGDIASGVQVWLGR